MYLNYNPPFSPFVPLETSRDCQLANDFMIKIEQHRSKPRRIPFRSIST
jgi:hypothetical protein